MKKSGGRFRQHCQSVLAQFLASRRSLSLTSSDRPKVSIVVVTYNQAEFTAACLSRIQEHVTVPMELIIVDNGSQDDTPRLLDRLIGARIIRNAQNRGFLIAVRQAIETARGEHILLLNNDAFLWAGSVEAAIATLESDTSIGAVGGPLINVDGNLQEAGAILWRDGRTGHYGAGCDPGAPEFQFRRDVDYCSGAFLLFRASVWRALGGFDDAFVPAYCEEVDFCIRLREANLRVVYEPCAVVTHFEFGSAIDLDWARTLIRRNQARLVEKHSAALRQQQPREARNELLARARAPLAGRVLFCDDDHEPGQASRSTPSRSSAIVRSLVADGYFVTVLRIAATADRNDEPMPPEVEVLPQERRIEALLAARGGFYDSIVAKQSDTLERIRSILASARGGPGGPRVIPVADVAVLAKKDALPDRPDGSGNLAAHYGSA